MFISSLTSFASEWFWIGGYRNLTVATGLEDGLAVEYNQRAYTFNELFSWYFVDGTAMFSLDGPDAEKETVGCLFPERYPLIDCEFMMYNLFAPGVLFMIF